MPEQYSVIRVIRMHYTVIKKNGVTNQFLSIYLHLNAPLDPQVSVLKLFYPSTRHTLNWKQNFKKLMAKNWGEGNHIWHRFYNCLIFYMPQ